MRRQLFFLVLMVSLACQAFALYSDAAGLSSGWDLISPNPTNGARQADGKLLLKASALNGESDLYSGSNFNAPLTGNQSGVNDSHLPFVFHRNFDTGSQSYVSFFQMNARGTYTGVSVRYGQNLPERTVSLEEFDQNGNLSFSKIIARRPAGYGIGDFGCPTADFESDGSMYVLFNNYIPGQEWNSVMKLNTAGDSVWEVMVSEKWQWSAIVMPLLKTYPSGGFVVAGSTNGFPTKSRVNRYTGTGELLWSQTGFSTDNGYNKINAVTVNSDGSIFVGGNVHHNLNERLRTMIAKLNSEGVIEWQKVYYSGYYNSGDSLTGEITSILPTADGGCVAGGFENEKGSGGGWAMFRKLSASGETEWIKRYFYTGGWQDAKVTGMAHLPSTNHFIAFAHRDWGSTNAKATLMECDENGDTLWTQMDYDYRFELAGVDADGNVLMNASAPYAPTNWNLQRLYLRTTPDGLYHTPELNYPFDNYDNIVTQPRFEWTSTRHINKTSQLQVATDSAFVNLIADKTGIAGNTYDQIKLPAGTRYYFRVREVGVKGYAGNWSAPRSFITEKGTGTDGLDVHEVRILTDNNSRSLKVILAPELGEVRLMITDVSGRVIINLETANNEFVVNGLETGIYLLRIIDQNNTIKTSKFRVN